MVRYLVTGAAGFIGSGLCEHLLDRGKNVLGLDCFTSYYDRSSKERNLDRLRQHACFELAEVDLRSADLSRYLEGVDVVMHLAGQPGVRGSWGDQFTDYVGHNISATHRLLEAAVAADVSRFVYASSSSIYGNATTIPTTEAVLPQPFSPYGVTKLAAEHLCAVYAANWGLHTVSLRYFTVYGPRQRPDMGFHRFIEATIQGTPIDLFGTGNQRRDFTFVDDVVRANLRAAHRAVPAGSAINIAGGSQASINQVLDHISRVLDRRAEVRRSKEVAGDVDETSADCTMAQLLLAWEPQVDLLAGLEAQVAWHLENRPAGAGARA